MIANLIPVNHDKIRRRKILSSLRTGKESNPVRTASRQNTMRDQMLCQQPVKLYKTCDITDASIVKSISKNRSTSLINVEDTDVKAISIPVGCRVKVYSHVISGENVRILASQLNAHALIAEGPMDH